MFFCEQVIFFWQLGGQDIFFSSEMHCRIFFSFATLFFLVSAAVQEFFPTSFLLHAFFFLNHLRNMILPPFYFKKSCAKKENDKRFNEVMEVNLF